MAKHLKGIREYRSSLCYFCIISLSLELLQNKMFLKDSSDDPVAKGRDRDQTGVATGLWHL